MACGRLDLLDGTTNVVTNPTVLVKVLSPGKARFDRIEKLAGYRSIPTLRHDVRVGAAVARVEPHARGDPGGWTLWEHGPGETFTLDSPTVTLAVDARYAGVEGPCHRTGQSGRPAATAPPAALTARRISLEPIFRRGRR